MLEFTSNNRFIKVESLPKGTLISFTACTAFEGGEYEGIIQIEGGRSYLCQDLMDGISCNDKLGRKYSWILSDDEAMIPDSYYMSPDHEVKIDTGEEVMVIKPGWDKNGDGNAFAFESSSINGSTVLDNYFTL